MCIAGAIVGAAVIGAGASVYSSNQAANAQQDAANQATGTQISMYNQTRADQAPWRQAGGEALNALQGFYGLPNGASAAGPTGVGAPYGGYGSLAGDPRGGQFGGLAGRLQNAPGAQQPAQQQPNYQQILQNLPGYQFQFQQGTKATQQDLAARGLLNSGAGLKALTQYGQGVASQYAGQYVNGLQSLAGLGQTANQATGAFGANAANQISSNQIYSGNASAYGAIGQGQAISSGLQGLANAYGRYNAPGPYGGYGGGDPYYEDAGGQATSYPTVGGYIVNPN